MFLVCVAVFLANRRKKQAKNYPVYWELFEQTKEANDDSALLKYADLVVWNDNLLDDHKAIVYKEIEKRSNLPAFKKIWKDVHYKTHGVEPV